MRSSARSTGRFPENRILSHDLLEGCYARSGLLSDVQLYEEYPSRYSADVSRRHRWIRGDWQIARWLLPRVPARRRQAGSANPLSRLSQWKIFDNLRRSLVAAALMLLLLLGWTCCRRLALDVAIVAASCLAARRSSGAAAQARRRAAAPAPRRGAALAGAPAGAGGVHARLPALRGVLSASTRSLRTAWRMLVTRRRLLEWTPSGERRRASDSLR